MAAAICSATRNLAFQSIRIELSAKILSRLPISGDNDDDERQVSNIRRLESATTRVPWNGDTSMYLGPAVLAAMHGSRLSCCNTHMSATSKRNSSILNDTCCSPEILTATDWPFHFARNTSPAAPTRPCEHAYMAE